MQYRFFVFVLELLLELLEANMSAQLPRSNVRMSPRLSGNPSHSRATTKGHHHSEPPPAAGNVGTKSKSSGREKRRFREAKQRTTAAYFASEEGSSGEDLVLKKGASLQSQPQHHQMKYLSVNADQSGGSCLSSDNNGGGGNGDNTLNPNRLHLQLRKFASPGGAQKGTKRFWSVFVFEIFSCPVRYDTSSICLVTLVMLI